MRLLRRAFDERATITITAMVPPLPSLKLADAADATTKRVDCRRSGSMIDAAAPHFAGDSPMIFMGDDAAQAYALDLYCIF